MSSNQRVGLVHQSSRLSDSSGLSCGGRLGAWLSESGFLAVESNRGADRKTAPVRSRMANGDGVKNGG